MSDNTPAPPDATWLGLWMYGHSARVFFATEHEIHDLTLDIVGWQRSDGPVLSRSVELSFADTFPRLLTAAQLRDAALAFRDNPLADIVTRDMARAMLDAANEIDALEH